MSNKKNKNQKLTIQIIFDTISAQEANMKSSNLFTLFLSYTIPGMIGMLVVGSYNIIDTIFIGHSAGELGLAAVSISWPIIMLVGAIGDMVGTGAAILISQAKGRNNFHQARSFLGNMLVSQVLLSAFLIPVLLLLLETILIFLQAKGELLQQAMSYGHIAICGGVATMFMMGTSVAIRNDGRPRLAMWLTVSGLALNVLLDYIFIFPLQGGIQGAAYATILSESIQAIGGLTYFCTRYTKLRLKPSLIAFGLKSFFKMAKSGIPTLGSHLALITMLTLHNYQSIRYGGQSALAAYTFIGSIESVCTMLLSGIAAGVQPLISFWYGAKQYTKQHKITQLGFAMAFFFGLTFSLAFIFTSNLTPLWFNLEGTTAVLAAHGLRISAVALSFIGLIKIATIYYQATNKIAKASMLIYGDTFLLLPLCLFILPIFFGLNGVWMAMPVSRIILLLFIFYLWLPKILLKKAK